MDDQKFDRLLSVCKHLANRYPNIKNQEKEDLVYDLLMYLNKWTIYFEKSDRVLTRKQLISIGWNYIKPREPFQLGKKITI